MDTKRKLSERLTGPDDNNNEHQIDTLSGTKNVTAVTSTDVNEPPAAVILRRKGVFKRFRRWAGKRSRAVRRVCSLRSHRIENRVEVTGKLMTIAFRLIIIVSRPLVLKGENGERRLSVTSFQST